MPMDTHPLELSPPGAPRKSQGRPRKYIEPTDGSPVPREVQEAIKRRERENAAYRANPAAKSARVYANFKKRTAKQQEALRQFEEIKKAFATLIAAPAGAA